MNGGKMASRPAGIVLTSVRYNGMIEDFKRRKAIRTVPNAIWTPSIKRSNRRHP